MERFNHGEHFGVYSVIGLRHPDSLAISAHGAFVAAKLTAGELTRICVFHAGIQFPAVCPSDVMLEQQITKLVEEGWIWMTLSEVCVCCCGMSHPGPDEPFWRHRYYVERKSWSPQ
jgi:hypothetical protein